ncbi:MAG: GNAT family N-acetyltransferase [Thermomicrobiales bacterium]
MRTDITRVDALAPSDREALRALTVAVYTPAVIASLPAMRVTWAQAEWSIRVWDDAERLVSHVGVLARTVLVDGARVQIGGIGGVKTHPDARGKGYASSGIREAVRFFTDELRVAFALLVCLPPTVPFYERQGWQRFDGTLLVQQPDGIISFTANLPMVLPILSPAPADGTIDLCGEPW